jgi:hypothetical protein
MLNVIRKFTTETIWRLPHVDYKVVENRWLLPTIKMVTGHFG